MLKISNQKMITFVFFSTTLLSIFSCTLKDNSISSPSSEVVYKTFTEVTNYYIDFLPIGIDSDTDYDSIFKIDIRNDMLANWVYWVRNQTNITEVSRLDRMF